ncbi:MAG: hypothetical protein JWO48_3672 [Bryobacterales bacterium]|nr:hypothetical protein [Bryobacterales bacterium]
MHSVEPVLSSLHGATCALASLWLPHQLTSRWSICRRSARFWQASDNQQRKSRASRPILVIYG